MKKDRTVSIASLLFLLNGLIITCGFIYLLAQNMITVRTVAENQTAENMRIFGTSLVRGVTEHLNDEDSFLKKFDFRDQNKDFRITVIAPDGVVIADSEVEDISTLENHRYRDEVKEALNGKEGKSVHKSSVSKNEVMYYALPLPTDEGFYVLRLAVPLSAAVYFSKAARDRIIVTMFTVFVVITLLTFIVSAFIVHQINELEELSAEYKGGNFDAKSTVNSPKELSKLGRRMEVMATEMKRLEQVRKDFVSNVSHELKTPVTSITGFTETLLDGALDDKKTAVHFLQIINAQSRRLMAIIEDLLTLSRLEKDNRKPETMKHDITDATRHVCTRFKEKAEAKNMKLTCSVDLSTLTETRKERPVLCMLNEGLYDEALGNLIDNAIKYCPENTEIECSIQMVQGKNAVQVAVEDNGAGIPEEFRKRIFERFYRIDKGRSRDMGGTGLGLSIAAHIIKAHDGNMYVTDRQDKNHGARFVIELPVVKK